MPHPLCYTLRMIIKNDLDNIIQEAAKQPTLGKAQLLLETRLWMQGVKVKQFHMDDLKKEFDKVNGWGSQCPTLYDILTAW